MNQIEKEEKEFSIIDLLMILWKQKVIIAGVTAILTIIILFAGVSWRNNRMSVSVSFEIFWPGIDEKRYSDNSLFDYRKIIDPELLNEMKALDEKYKDIDFEWLVESGSIGITNKTYKKEESTITELYSSFYEISIVNGALGLTDDETKDFIAIFLNDVFRNRFLKEKNNHSPYTNSLENLDEGVEYIELITFITNQKGALNSAINDLKANPIIDSKSQQKIEVLEKSIYKFFLRNETNILLGDIKKEGFFKNSNYIDIVSSKISDLEIALAELESFVTSISEIYKEFPSLTVTIPSLDAALEKKPSLVTELEAYKRIETAINGPVDNNWLLKRNDFDKKINGVVDQFDIFYNEFTEVFISIREENTMLVVTGRATTAPLPTLYILIGALGFSVIVGCGVGIVYHFIRDNKKKF